MRQAQDDCRDYRATQGKTEKEEKEQKMSGKRKNIPNSQTVSQLGSAGPSVNEAGGPERYIAHPRELVAATRPGIDSDGPSRDTVAGADSSVSPTGSAGEPLEMGPIERPAELQRAGISSVVRLKGAVVELRARVRGASLHSLVELGLTGNYMSD